MSWKRHDDFTDEIIPDGQEHELTVALDGDRVETYDVAAAPREMLLARLGEHLAGRAARATGHRHAELPGDLAEAVQIVNDIGDDQVEGGGRRMVFFGAIEALRAHWCTHAPPPEDDDGPLAGRQEGEPQWTAELLRRGGLSYAASRPCICGGRAAVDCPRHGTSRVAHDDITATRDVDQDTGEVTETVEGTADDQPGAFHDVASAQVSAPEPVDESAGDEPGVVQEAGGTTTDLADDADRQGSGAADSCAEAASNGSVQPGAEDVESAAEQVAAPAEEVAPAVTPVGIGRSEASWLPCDYGCEGAVVLAACPTHGAGGTDNDQPDVTPDAAIPREREGKASPEQSAPRRMAASAGRVRPKAPSDTVLRRWARKHDLHCPAGVQVPDWIREGHARVDGGEPDDAIRQRAEQAAAPASDEQLADARRMLRQGYGVMHVADVTAVPLARVHELSQEVTDA